MTSVYNLPKLKQIKIKLPDMKFMKQALFIVVSSMALYSCVKVDLGDDVAGPGGNDGDPNETKILSGTIDQSVTLKKGTFTLRGYVYVNNGAILTIEPRS